jgi:predicted ATPase
MPRVVITGGPGAGKTNLLVALQDRGYSIVGDAARAIIQNRRKLGLSPRPGAAEFAQEVLDADIDGFVRHATTPGYVFYERGVLDSLGMLSHVVPLGESELDSWLSLYPYFPKVFILPPWSEIYTNDAERDHTFAHAEKVHAAAAAWYRSCGYQLFEVPRVSVAERCAYVLQVLASTDA